MKHDGRVVFLLFLFFINSNFAHAELGTLEEAIAAGEAGREPDYIKPLMQLHLKPKLEQFATANNIQTATQKMAWWLTMRSVLEVIAHSTSAIHAKVAQAKWRTGADSALGAAVHAAFGPIWAFTDSKHYRTEGEAVRNAAFDVVNREIGFDQSSFPGLSVHVESYIRASSAYKEALQFTSEAYRHWELQWDPDSTKRKSEPNAVYDTSKYGYLTRHSATMNQVANRIAEWRLLNWGVDNIDSFLWEAYSAAFQALIKHGHCFAGNGNLFDSHDWLSEFIQGSEKRSRKHDAMVYLAPWLAPLLTIDLGPHHDGRLTVFNILPPRVFNAISSTLLQAKLPEQFQYGFLDIETPRPSGDDYMEMLQRYQKLLDEVYKK